MRRFMNVLVVGALLSVGTEADAAEPMSMPPTVSTSPSSGFELEWDPSVLLLQGFSAVAVYGPAALPQWRFGVDVYTFQLPGFQLQTGWQARAFGATALARFHPWGAPQGFWVAAMVRGGYWRYAYLDQGTDAVLDLSVIPRIGFNWYPFGLAGRFYVAPQIGVAIPVLVSGGPTVGAESHPRLSPFPTPAVHLGWTF